jgi:hypothetical protein
MTAATGGLVVVLSIFELDSRCQALSQVASFSAKWLAWLALHLQITSAASVGTRIVDCISSHVVSMRIEAH